MSILEDIKSIVRTDLLSHTGPVEIDDDTSSFRGSIELISLIERQFRIEFHVPDLTEERLKSPRAIADWSRKYLPEQPK